MGFSQQQDDFSQKAVNGRSVMLVHGYHLEARHNFCQLCRNVFLNSAGRLYGCMPPLACLLQTICESGMSKLFVSDAMSGADCNSQAFCRGSCFAEEPGALGVVSCNRSYVWRYKVRVRSFSAAWRTCCKLECRTTWATQTFRSEANDYSEPAMCSLLQTVKSRHIPESVDLVI